MTIPRLLVCGSRSVDHTSKEEYIKVAANLSRICFERGLINREYGIWIPTIILINGKCPTGGIDRIAEDWAISNWCVVEEYPPLPEDIRQWGFGIAANMRNQRMIDEGKPDLVVAFRGGSGTRDMVDRARRAGVS